MSGLQNTSAEQDNSSRDDEPLRIAACCKHFIANSLESWKNHTRHNFNAQIADEDLHDYYYQPFQECVQAKAAGVMCSYNALNGIPTCLSKNLLNQTLRQSWGFDGYVVTDCWALTDTITGHNAAKDSEEASAMAKAATVDVNCGDTFQKGLLQAYQNGRVSDSEINSSFRRLARIQFRLGLFDSSKTFEPQEDIELVGSHGKLALEAALQSIVLLKNRNNILPLKTDHKVALIGPHVFGREVFLSNYHGEPCPPNSTGDKSFECIESPIEALSKMPVQDIKAIMGCKVADTDWNEIDKAVDLAKTSDAVVLMLGLDQTQEREERDRIETVLPGLQGQLLSSILDVAAEKTILVLVHGGAMSLGEDAIDRSGAILSTSYGGQSASSALAQVLFGLYNPTGKLSSTMYPPSYVHEIPLTEMGLAVGIGRTHMFYKKKPEFAFGHGLSYSSWNLSWTFGSSSSSSSTNDDPGDSPVISIEKSQASVTFLGVNVTNLGPMKGSQTVLLFWRPPKDGSSTRIRIRQKLFGFQGTSMLNVGESQVLTFQVQLSDFQTWNTHTGSNTVDPGTYYQIEAQAANTAISKKAQVLNGEEILSMAVD